MWACVLVCAILHFQLIALCIGTPSCNRSALHGARVRTARGLWSVPVSQTRLPEHDLVAGLRTLVFSLASRSAGVRKSNRGGWHSGPGQLLAAAVAGADTASLKDVLLRSAAAHLRHVLSSSPAITARSRGELAVSLMGVWANVNGAGDGNVAHRHPGLLSGVLYVDPGCTEGAILCLAEPRVGGLPHIRHSGSSACSSFESGSVAALPLTELQAGELVIFPSWLQHHVPPHRGASPRISISFNIRADVTDPDGPFRIATSELLDSHTTELSLTQVVQMTQFFGSVALHLESKHSTVPRFFPPAALGILVRLITARRLKPPQDLVASLATAGLLDQWRCLAAALAVQTPGMSAPGAMEVTDLLLFPRALFQAEREVIGARCFGLYVLSGAVSLWLFDPRPVVEVAAAADPVARRLFGEKRMLHINSGDSVVLPGWIEVSLETTSAPTALLRFEFIF